MPVGIQESVTLPSETLCGGSLVVSYRQEQLDLYCTECAGTYGASHATGEIVVPEGYGWLGGLPLPPAGIEQRTASEMLDAAVTLAQTEFTAASAGVCPRCSAAIDRFVEQCSDHDAGEGLCSSCDRRREIYFTARCTNCNFTTKGGLHMALLADTEFLDFMTSHGVDPLTPNSVQALYDVISEYETEIRSREPFEATVTLTLDGDSFSTIVGDDLTLKETNS